MKKLIFAMAIGFALVSFNTAHGQGYLRFEGVDGEVDVEGYEGWSEFTSVVHKIVPADDKDLPDVVDRGTLGTFERFAVIKPLDKASLKIAERTLKGMVTPRVEIEWVLPIGGGVLPYCRYELSNVSVLEYDSTGIGVSESDIGEKAQVEEHLVLDFDEIIVTYSEYDDDGNLLGRTEYSWVKSSK